MVDYTKLAATALRLIKKNGFQITVNKLGTTPADPNKPWRGPADNNNPLAATETLWAIEAGLSESDAGAVVKKKDIPDDLLVPLLVAPELNTPSLLDYDQVIVDGQTCPIVQITQLKPASTVLLYEIKVEK